MTESCERCGRCCRILAAKAVGMSPETLSYLITHGCTIDDGYVLIPNRCPHLRLDEKKSEYGVEEDGTRWLKTPKYMCDIHDKPEYPVLCKRFHGHGNFYIPNGCVFFTKQDEDTEKSIYLKSLERSQNKHKKQRTLVTLEEG